MAYALARFGARYLPRLARYAARAVPRFLRKRRPRRMMRPKKKIQNRVHTYVRWADRDAQYPAANGPSQIVETGSAQNLVYNFKLDNLTTKSDFTNLYDAYKITKVVLYLERLKNDTDDAITPLNKKVCVVWDDDGDALTTEDQYLEYSNCRRYSPIGNGAIKLTVYPKVSTPILNVGGNPTAYHSIPSTNNWIKIEDDEVPHFGLKIFVPGGIIATQVPLFTVRAKFYLAMKGAK